jgi:hypothetical protein
MRRIGDPICPLGKKDIKAELETAIPCQRLSTLKRRPNMPWVYADSVTSSQVIHAELATHTYKSLISKPYKPGQVTDSARGRVSY